MSDPHTQRWEDQLRDFTESLLGFDTTTGPSAEIEAQNWFRDQLEDFGFQIFEWTPDPDRLANHPTFPNDDIKSRASNRPCVGGVLEFGDPKLGKTIILNGHIDVVSVNREAWSSDPFNPTWNGDKLVARGAADMKSGLAACVFAARRIMEKDRRMNGRIVVESVAGEEDGGVGSAAAALNNPYPFERDAAIIAEPTDLRIVRAIEGTLFAKLTITGKSAHAGHRWEGTSVLPLFEKIRKNLEELEIKRSSEIRHPLYDEFPIAWPVNFGTVRAGEWPSSVPDQLESKIRIGVAPSEEHNEVFNQFKSKLQEINSDDDWLSAHPASLEMFAPNFPSAETPPNHPVVKTAQNVLRSHGYSNIEPQGAVFGSDAARYIDMADIPSILLGPGSPDQAHQADEFINWPEVIASVDLLADVSEEFLISNNPKS